LFSLLDASIAEGYNKSYNNFSTKFEKISKDITSQTSEQLSSKKRK
jgi:hypothetical protein